jgi:hypothetical protein
MLFGAGDPWRQPRYWGRRRGRCDQQMQASPGSDRGKWAYGVRRVVYECSTALFVATQTAVTWGQPNAVGDDRGGKLS